MTEPNLTRGDLKRLDAADSLAPFRSEFRLPPDIIYLDGNSLGPLPKATPGRIKQLIEQEWGDDLIRSWNSHDWINFPARIGAKIANIVGAEATEVVAADSTSVNLFKLLSAAMTMRPDRRVILSDIDNFPTDLYIAQGLSRHLGGDIEVRLLPRNEILGALDNDVAVLSLTQTDYRTGEIYDMADVTRRAQAAGALMLWDLSHSAGAYPVDLDDANVDLAVGCGYKYLNGGPGAPAFLFVAKRHHAEFEQPLSGWMGHAAPFEFSPNYKPAEGISRYLCGTPSIIALAALEVGIDILAKADMTAIRTKSIKMGELFADLVSERCDGFGFGAASPSDGAQRGSQISFAHDHGYPIMRALIARGVIGDFRAPNILRFGFAPLYLRHTDIWDAVEVLRDIMETGAWDDPVHHARSAVT